MPKRGRRFTAGDVLESWERLLGRLDPRERPKLIRSLVTAGGFWELRNCEEVEPDPTAGPLLSDVMKAVQWHVSNPSETLLRLAEPHVERAAKFKRKVEEDTLEKAHKVLRLMDEEDMKFATAAKRVGWETEAAARKAFTRLRNKGLIPQSPKGTHRPVQ
jgi:hypothetical protein